MIASFKNRALKALWTKGDATKIPADLLVRLKRRLDALNAARVPRDMDLPGFDFHQLRGKPIRYTIHINGPWCVTFEWDGEDATAVDFENYH